MSRRCCGVLFLPRQNYVHGRGRWHVDPNDAELWERAWSFKDHGKNCNAANMRQISSRFRWLHDSFGTNWRLTEMQAAIGRSLLATLPAQLEIRRKNANILSQRFGSLPALRVTIPPQEICHAYYKYYVFLRAGLMREGWSRDHLLQAIAAEGIPCFSGSCSEIYLDGWRDASNKVGHLGRAK